MQRASGTYDEECLKATAQLLAANPDATTLWNIRRETLLANKRWVCGLIKNVHVRWSDFHQLYFCKVCSTHPLSYPRVSLFFPSENEESWSEVLQSELKMVETCLMKNHKSYGAWHHRCWVMENFPNPPWAAELKLCDSYLKLDERNCMYRIFCWVLFCLADIRSLYHTVNPLWNPLLYQFLSITSCCLTCYGTPTLFWESMEPYSDGTFFSYFLSSKLHLYSGVNNCSHKGYHVL